MTDFAQLEKKIGYSFTNKGLLETALTHRSYLNEQRKRRFISNERLEFLGDAVLEFIISEWLYQQFPAYPEGKLTAVRSNLVKTSSLARVAHQLNLGEHLKMSKGEKDSLGGKNPTILANALEAVIGAVYLDQGEATVRDFLKKNLTDTLNRLIAEGKLKDPKSLLQEKIQARAKGAPSYRVLQEEGPAHHKLFTVGVYLKNRLLATGNGKTKQEAEQNAAEKALNTYERLSRISG